ncbi:hypothetical protein QUB00_14985 [Microcoleus sp. F8_C2]
MSGNAKLIATEPSPNQLMIFAGRQAENPIARAIELPAAQVRVSIDCAILDFRF